MIPLKHDFQIYKHATNFIYIICFVVRNFATVCLRAVLVTGLQKAASDMFLITAVSCNVIMKPLDVPWYYLYLTLLAICGSLHNN